MLSSVENLVALDHQTMLMHDFGIINAMQVEPEARTDLTGQPLVPNRHNSRAHLFPLLVELRALTEHQRISLLDRMTSWQTERATPYFSALLACPDSTDVLRRHLIQRCDVTLPDGTLDVLRLHDPRLFRHLTWILRSEQLNTLLANVGRWTWPERDGTWRSMVHSDASPAHRLHRLKFDDAQWVQLARLCDLHAVLATLQQTNPSLTQDGALAQRVDAMLAKLERLPNANSADKQLFAEHAIRFGERLHLHPKCQAIMASVREGKRSYFSAFAAFDDETLAAWAASTEFAKELS